MLRLHVIRAVTQLVDNCAPLFKRITSQLFLRVGLCSHTVLPVLDEWRPSGRRMRSGRWRSRGPESTWSSLQHVRLKWFKWDVGCATRGVERKHHASIWCTRSHHAIVWAMDATWTHRSLDLHLTVDPHRDLITTSPDEASSDCRDLSRFRDRGAPRSSDLHRTVDRNPHQEDRKAYLLTHGLKWRVRSSSSAQSRSTVWSPSDGPESPRSPLIVATRGTLRSAGSPSDGSWYEGPTIMAHDRGSIVARSPRDRGWFTTKLRPRSSSTDQAAPTTDRGHQSVSTIASNGLKIRPRIPL